MLDVGLLLLAGLLVYAGFSLDQMQGRIAKLEQDKAGLSGQLEGLCRYLDRLEHEIKQRPKAGRA
jgi:cell division protein FtsB